MWMVFFVFAIIGVAALLVYLTIELNELDKRISSFTQEIQDHFGNPNQPQKK